MVPTRRCRGGIDSASSIGGGSGSGEPLRNARRRDYLNATHGGYGATRVGLAGREGRLPGTPTTRHR